MQQILIVEDDSGLNEGLCRALKAENRQIVSCGNLKSAAEQISCGEPSLMLLDINLPDGNGLDFLTEIRREKKVFPIILLTANDTDTDIVRGLEFGADDYITKPFSLSVLRARVNTQLRKFGDSQKETVFSDGPFLFDFEQMHFEVNKTAVELSKTEQRLLRLLVENCGNTLGRSMLVDRIWSDGGEFVDENALSVTIKRLRDKLHAQSYIRTIYGIGYRWEKQPDD